MTLPLTKPLEAKPHTAVYKMHKYFARRPWNIFSDLISRYTSPGDIVLDPFCGGGVTVVESMRLRRRVVGVDINPIATYVTEMEARPVDIDEFRRAFAAVSEVKEEILGFYETTCRKCRYRVPADWIEWDEKKHRMLRIKYACSNCMHAEEKPPEERDRRLFEELGRRFELAVKTKGLWFPQTAVPAGDKTDSLLGQGVKFFQELFTRRNLLALSILLKEIDRLEDSSAKDLLRFAHSSSLKWSSRLSHLRGEIVEGWAMHAYWIYPKSLEINIWKTFERRAAAVIRGKEYSNSELGDFCKVGNNFEQIRSGQATTLLLNQTAARLPLPNNSVDAVITDPPYGGNVNYGELADYWFVWLSRGRIIDKSAEIVVNQAQGKGLKEYENMLFGVLKECYRVLKPGKHLVATFNSRNVQVVASFIIAATCAGFELQKDDLQYQPPIRAYNTTLHAMQIGAFVGDFIFTFTKPHDDETSSLPSTDPAAIEHDLEELIEGAIGAGTAETKVRERAYGLLIPFLAGHARMNPDACRDAAEYFEKQIRKHARHFKMIRKRAVDRRRRTYLNRKVRRK